MEITLEKVFCDYVLDDDFVDSEKYQNATIAVDTFLNKQLFLEENLKSKLQDLIGESQFTAQKQGFENGFKYAMALKKECGLL